MSRTVFTDERLRRELSGLAEIRGEGQSCPDSERLVESARGGLSRADDRQVLLHIGECTACAAGWKIAREVAGGRVAGSGSARRGWVRWAAAAAMLIAAVGGSYLVLSPNRTEAPAYREQADWILESAIEESTPLPRDAFLLRWTAAPEGAVYDIVVTDPRLKTLARGSGISRPEFLVPEAALRDVPSGGRVLWQVSVRLSDGRGVESPTFFAVAR